MLLCHEALTHGGYSTEQHHKNWGYLFCSLENKTWKTHYFPCTPAFSLLPTAMLVSLYQQYDKSLCSTNNVTNSPAAQIRWSQFPGQKWFTTSINLHTKAWKRSQRDWRSSQASLSSALHSPKALCRVLSSSFIQARECYGIMFL